jgi:hypothetical protein
MGEMELKLWDQLDYSSDEREDSGYSKSDWRLSALYNVGVTQKFNVTFIVQLRTALHYTENTRENYYLDRTLNDETPVFFKFYRAAMIFSWKLF